MLMSFLEYLFESESKLVLPIYFSERFRKFLHKIETTSKDKEVSRLAEALRFSEDSNQMNSDITFIDMTNKNDMLSFIQVNRIKSKYDDTGLRTGLGLEDWTKLIWRNDPEQTLWTNGRSEVKVGKFCRKIFKDNNISTSDATIEKFSNAYKATFDFDFNLDQKMDLVSGEDIRKWYLYSNYSDTRGQLGNSCMRYITCQPYLDIYVKNEKVCNLLIMYSDESKTKLSGRAIIWKDTKGSYIMDRIYTSNDYDVEVFRKYASLKGWTDLSQNRITTTIQLISEVYEDYPYMDNFYIFDFVNFTLTNDDSNYPSSNVYKLQNTDGTYTSSEGIWSNYHSEYIDEEDAIYCQNVGDYVHRDDAIYLEYQDIYASPDEDTAYSEWFDQSFYLEDLIYSEVMSDYIPTNDSFSIYINSRGNEDYIVDEFSKRLMVTLDFDGEEIKTLAKFVTLNPITREYHFNDINIVDEILDKLIDIKVDTDKIKKYLLESNFEPDRNKLNDAMSIYKIWQRPVNIPGVIKYLLYAYPDKINQNHGMPVLPQEKELKNHQRYSRFKNSILNFDQEFLDVFIDKENLDKLSSDGIFNLTCLSQSFISDVFKDPEIYKMWYKWKNT